MKAVIAINDVTGEIRSGQTDGLEGFEYYILKFGDKSMPIAEIEMACYYMAIAAGVEMEQCRLLPIEGVNHFLTKRFDRKNGVRIHVQTLAAVNPEARSYEDLIDTCRELSISELEIEQLFVRMVFNVMANNTDDHNKNFSFLIEEKGTWRLAPAYDMTFIFNPNGTGPNIDRRFSIGGKTTDILKSDLLDFASLNGIKNANVIINRVAEAIAKFSEYAESCSVTHPWRDIIQKRLNDNLAAFGYLDTNDVAEKSFCDRFGRTIGFFSIEVNAKGHYAVSAIIDGCRRRRFVRPNMSLYSVLTKQDIYNLPVVEKIRLTETLFLPE